MKNLLNNLLNWVLKKGPSETKKDQAWEEKEQAGSKKDQVKGIKLVQKRTKLSEKDQVKRTKLVQKRTKLEKAGSEAREVMGSEAREVMGSEVMSVKGSEAVSANHALITQLSRTNHPISLRAIRYAAVLFMVLMVGIGNAWGTNQTYPIASPSQNTYTDATSGITVIGTSGTGKIDNKTSQKVYLAKQQQPLYISSIKANIKGVSFEYDNASSSSTQPTITITTGTNAELATPVGGFSATVDGNSQATLSGIAIANDQSTHKSFSVTFTNAISMFSLVTTGSNAAQIRNISITYDDAISAPSLYATITPTGTDAYSVTSGKGSMTSADVTSTTTTIGGNTYYKIDSGDNTYTPAENLSTGDIVVFTIGSSSNTAIGFKVLNAASGDMPASILINKGLASTAYQIVYVVPSTSSCIRFKRNSSNDYLKDIKVYHTAASSCSDDTGLAYGETTVNKTYGDGSFTNTLTNSNSLSVTYSSSNTNVATVNESTGAVTIAGAGTTTITATWAGNATYCADAVSYTLNVKPAVGSVSGAWDRFGGETISLSVTPSGGSSYTYQWQKWYNSQWNNISNGADGTATISGATTNNLQISTCHKDNSGSYRCQVTAGGQTNETDGHQVKVYVLECYNSGTTVYNFTRDGNNQRGSLTIDLAASTNYGFKVHADNDYYGNNGTVYEDVTNWVCSTDQAGNLTIAAGLGGTFTITMDYSASVGAAAEGIPEVSITYPRKRMYLTPGVWNADGAKFALYYFRKVGETTYGNGWTDFLTANDCGMSAEIPQWSGVKINAVRLSDDATVGTWDKKWNQTSDITVNSNNSVVITDWGTGDSPYTYGTYSTPTYTISYAKGTPAASIDGSKADETKTCGVAFTLPNSAVFTRTGYTQTGWTTSDGGAQEYALGGTYTTNEDKTFYPVWTVNQYTVTHTLDGVTKSSGATGANAATYGTNYTAEFAASSGYALPETITVTIGGSTKTAGTEYTWNQGTGTVTITGSYITGNIVITVNGESDSPCVIPAALTNEIARFQVPCDVDRSTTYNVTNEPYGSTNTYTTNSFGGSSNWYYDETTGLSYGKMTSTSGLTITIKLNTGNFQAGDVVYVYSNRNETSKGGVKVGSTNKVTIGVSSTAAGVEASGSYPLLSTDIEDDGSLKFYREGSNSYINRIIVTRPACVNVSISTQPTTPVAATVGSACSITGLVAAGTSPTYQWYTCNSDGSGATAITSTGAMSFTGYTTATLGLTPTAAGATYYKCVVSGSCGDPVTSSVVTVNATAAATCTGDPTALVSGTLYKVEDMASACANALNGTGQQKYGLSSNGKFYVVGTTNDNNSSTGTVEMKTDVSLTDIGGDSDADFTNSAWLKMEGSTSHHSIKFVIPTGGGKLVVYGKGGGSTKGNVQIKENSTGTVTEVIAKGSTTACKSSEISVNAGTYYIYSSGASAALYGLKFVETSCSTPAAPTAFAAGSITSTGATFSITDAANAASYDIYYTTSSTAPTAGTAATTTSTEKTKTVTGLTASTTYYAWVRSVCDASHKSAWVALTSPTAKFTTSAAAALNDGCWDPANTAADKLESGDVTLTTFDNNFSGVTGITSVTLSKGTGDGKCSGADETPTSSGYLKVKNASSDGVKIITIVTSAAKDITIGGEQYGSNTGSFYLVKSTNESTKLADCNTGATAKATNCPAGTYYVYAKGNSSKSINFSLLCIEDAAPDVTAPTFVSSVPANGATDVATSGTIVLTFSESIASVDGTKFTLTNATKGAVSIDGSDNTKVNIAYSGADNSTTVTLATAAGAVADASSNASAALSNISFTTVAAAAPTLYTVTFNSNGGSSVSPIEQASEGASITMPAAPTYNGYTFQGWVIGGTTYAAEASYTPTANITAYASWKADCAGGGGSGTITIGDFETGKHDKSDGKPDDFAKYQYGYINPSAKTSANAVTITTSSGNSCYQNSGADFLIYYGNSIRIYANNTTTGGIPASFEDVTSVSLKIKNANSSSFSSFSIKVGETTVANAVALSAEYNSYKVYTVSGLSNLDGRITIINHGTGGTGKNFYIDDIAITTAGGGATCYYVTYDGNGAESGCVSDATAYTLRASVDIKDNTFVKSDSRFNGWNTSATGNGTSYAAGAKLTITEDITLYAQWVADACSAPSAPTISGTSVRTVGQTITLNAACATGADASTTYTWYKGDTWETTSPVQAALTAGEGGRIFNKASCAAGDAGKYWCEASNGDGCEAHNATGFAVTVNAAGEEHIYYYKDADHYDSETDTYYNPEGNTATLKDNQNLSSPWTICNACMTGVDSVVAHNATYDGKGNHMNAYIKLPTDGTATTNNVKFALSAGYTGTLTVKIGGYNSNPTVSLYKLASVNGAIDGDAVTPTSGEVGGVATTENNFNAITWPLSTAGGTYVLKVTSKTGYISLIDMTTTATAASFNVTYNGNGNTGGNVPTDATNYIPGATVTVAANTGDGKLVKENYTGAGWNTANNGTGTNYVPGTGTFSITANTTLYAHWTQLITLAPGAQGTGTNNAAVSWNGSVLRGFAAHTASGYALQGYYTEPSGGTKVLNADGSFAATDIDGFVTSGKWSNTGAAPTLYAQWEASNLLKWNLKVNVEETSITTLSKESAAPTVIAVANMGNLTNNGSLTITGSAKSALTSKIATTESATGDDAGKYMSVQFEVAAGYQLVPSDIKVKVQPISHSQTTKLILEDNNSQSISYTSGSLSKGSTQTVTMTNSEEVAFTGTVTLKIYVYGTAENDGYRLGTPIEINGSVEATCATPPTFDGLSYDATEYTVGASASAISVTGAENVDTYAWKQNDVNDRSGGEAASGTNDATSYTPPTSTIGTKYYWCEMTNTTCGITIKTPAVGITVRNATTDPTVTWSNVKLGATDDVTPNYGGGNYVLRATVNETSWPGTLAASMITAPAGIRIHHVTTGKADSKNYIEFQFDVTTAFDRASNATIDFNLALPEAGSYSALNSLKSVTYNDCSSGAAGQVAIKMGATASTSKSNPQNYWETAGAGRLMFNYGSSMGSSYNSAGYKTADSTFYYYAASTGQKWMFQTYIAGVNKVRVAFRAAGTIKSSKATITDFYYNTEYFASPGSNAVSFGEVNANKAGYSSGEDGYIEFTVPEMAANSYGAFVTGDGNMKVYGVVLYSENAGDGGSVKTSPVWSGSLANDGTATVNKTQSDANFTYTISTTTNTLGAISYSSSDPSVAAVDPVTGEVTITATGANDQSAKITATLARSGCYQGETRTYKINVTGLSCSDVAGTITTEDLGCDGIKMTLSGYTEGASIQWYKDGETIPDDGDEPNVYTATSAGRYYAVTHKDCNRTSNTVEVAGSSVSATREISKWYIKNGRPTPDIKLWTLGKGTHLTSVAWSPDNGNGTGLTGDDDIYERDGAVWLNGRQPNTNSGEDVSYTLTLTANNGCSENTTFNDASQQITIVHQKNTDKHVLAFVVNGTAKGGFTEGITAAQTTSVDLYNAIAAQFDVQATNIYSTDDEQKLREYYSQYDILCITDYPNTQTKGINSKSYVDAIGALIDIRPILTMEAYVSSLSNWKLKGVSGNPKSPSTRQYTMLLQCKDHEIFNGVTTTKIGEGDEAMYRVTVVDKSQEEYKTLDANYGDGEHKSNEGYQYGKKPALQGFTYTEEMSDNDMLPLGLIDDGAGNDLQVGIERQHEMSARMMVLGINSYAMERLDGDGKTIVINALKYLMKKNAEDISDCSVYFDGSDESDPTNWDNELNWGPSYASLPLYNQEVRILKPCVVKDGTVARASGIKIIPRGRINHDTDNASGSLTIEPGGALIVDGEVRAATAPYYFNAYPTTPSNLVLQSNSSAQAALIFDNSEGETHAVVEMWNPSYWEVEGGKKKKYWSYVAVPIQEADIPNFFWYGFTYLYDETSGWIKKSDGTSLYPFQGIGASLQEGNMETFYGPLATTESQDITLTYTGGKGQGMNLIGNSWTAPIQIANFEEDDFGDATAEVWVFNTGHTNDGHGDGTTTTAGQWNTIPINAPSLPGYEGLKVIPAMQAFEVNTTTETTLHLDYDRLVRAGRENLNEPMRAPRRSAAKQIEATMRVRVSGESTHTDVYLLKDARFSDAFDNGWDGHFLSGDDRSAQLYAISEEEGALAFIAQPEIEGTVLGFAPSRDGNEYTFSFHYFGDEEFYLNDLKLKKSTPVQEDETYQFTYEEGDANRFYISKTAIDAPQVPTGVTDLDSEAPKARKVIYNDKMYIFNNGRVYDAQGKVVK